MRFLCIDYGDKIIGLAVSDPSGKIAHGRGVLERINLEADLQELCGIIEDEKIEQIVVGLNQIEQLMYGLMRVSMLLK